VITLGGWELRKGGAKSQSAGEGGNMEPGLRLAIGWGGSLLGKTEKQCVGASRSLCGDEGYTDGPAESGSVAGRRSRLMRSRAHLDGEGVRHRFNNKGGGGKIVRKQDV